MILSIKFLNVVNRKLDHFFILDIFKINSDPKKISRRKAYIE